MRTILIILIVLLFKEYDQYSFIKKYINPVDTMIADSITINDTNIIAFFGNSYWHGAPFMLDLGAVSRFSEKSPFKCSNWSLSGGTINHVLSYINNNPHAQHTALFRNTSVTYAIIGVGHNDKSYYNQAQFDSIYSLVIDTLQSLGITPILTAPWKYTPFTNNPDWSYILETINSLATKYNLPVIDYLTWSNYLAGYASADTILAIRKSNLNNSSNEHPNSMSEVLSSEYLYRRLYAMRPLKSMKIWRPDTNTVNGLTLSQARDTLKFTGIDDKIGKWMELHLSQLYGGDTSVAYDTSMDEYEILNADTVDFDSSLALIEFFVPSGISDVNFTYNLGESKTINLYLFRSDFILLRKHTGTSLSIDIENSPTNSRYYFLLEDSAKSGFSLAGSPKLKFNRQEYQLGPSINIRYETTGSELASNPYFNLNGRAEWTISGCDTIDTDTYTWTSPVYSKNTAAVRSPFGCDDTCIIIGTGDSLYRGFDLSSISAGSDLRMEIICENDSSGYNCMSSMDVSLRWDAWNNSGDDETIEIHPIYFDHLIYFTKSSATLNDSLFVMLKKTQGYSDIILAKVGIKRIQ